MTDRDRSIGIVPKGLVHRPTTSDVLPTGWRRVDQENYRVSARLPHDETRFRTLGGRYAPVLVAELMRQSVILLAHAELGVPDDHRFVMQNLNYVATSAALTVDGMTDEVELAVHLPEPPRRGRLRGTQARLVVSRSDRVVATGGGLLSCSSPAAYTRMRGDRAESTVLPPPADPVDVRAAGRFDPAEVVLSPSGAPDRWRLRTDPLHPALRDRAYDHVPGTLLIEAATQAAQILAGTGDYYPAALSVDFTRYVEHDPPCVVTATPSSDGRGVVVHGEQAGEPAFRAVIEDDRPHRRAADTAPRPAVPSRLS